ncbi:MAG: hypothetical protein MJA31_05370, partial [Clostridia bacterium]|nr:hypothetical protein [Clostridia bacterium]
MKPVLFLNYLLFMLLLIICQCSQCFASNLEKKHILVLHSYHSNFEWTEGIMEGISTEFQNADFGTDIFVEYMDTKVHSLGDVCDRLASVYEAKYKGKDIDVI